MNKTVNLVVMLISVALLATVLAITPVHADQVEIMEYYWGEPGERWAAMPGDRDAKLIVVVQNMEDTTICGLVATLSQREPGTPFPFRDRDGKPFITSYYVGSIPTGSSETLEFDVSIDPDAEPGFYKATLHLRYVDCEDPDYPEMSTTQTIDLKVWDEPEIKVVDSSWVEADGSPTHAGPGDHAKFLSLTFHVPRYYMASNVKAVLHLNRYFTNLTGGDVVEEFYAGEARGGQTFTLRFGLNVAEDAPTGVHTLKATLIYYDRWLTEKTQEIEVPVKVTGSGDLEISYQGLSIPAGSTKPLPILIKNTGTAPIYRLEAHLTAAGGLVIVSGDSETMEVLMPGESMEFEPMIMAPPTASEGAYSLSLKVEYADSAGNKEVETREIGVYVRSAPEIGLTASLEGGPLTASRTNKVAILVKNLYDGPVTEVKTLLTLKGLPMVVAGGEPNAYFPRIEPGEAGKMELEILVSPQAEETVYEAELAVTYRDPMGQPRTDSLPVPMIVQGALRLEFREIQVASTSLYPGATVDIIGELLNGGTVTARLTEVTLALSPPFSETPDSTYYIGDITAYSTASFTLSFRIDEDAEPGRYPLKMVAVCENSYGDRITVEKTIEVEVGEKPLPQSIEAASSEPFPISNLLLPIGVLVIIIVAVAVIYAARRRKRVEAS